MKAPEAGEYKPCLGNSKYPLTQDPLPVGMSGTGVKQAGRRQNDEVMVKSMHLPSQRAAMSQLQEFLIFYFFAI